MILFLNEHERERVTNIMEPHQFPRTNNPSEAAAILAALQEKKEAGVLCLYPGCPNERQPATGKSGRRKGYCSLEEHNITTAFQERQRLKALVAETAQESSSPADKRSPTTLHDSIMSLILHLEKAPSYLAELRAIGNPDLALSKSRAAEDQASIRIAEAEGQASEERSRRLAAEKAREEAEGEAQEAKEAAEAAIGEMEAAAERARLQREEAEQQMTELQAEKDSAIVQVQAEAVLQKEEIERQAREAIAKAEAATAQAQTQAREDETRAHDAETNARSQSTTADQLVTEARATLERERAEVDRLPEELASIPKQAEADRAEAPAPPVRA